MSPKTPCRLNARRKSNGSSRMVLRKWTIMPTRQKPKAPIGSINPAWNRYLAFCKFYAINPLSGDPAQIAFYIANCAKHRKDKPGIPYSPNTLNYHIAAIQAAHLEHNIPLNLKHGVFRKVWDGYRRSHSGEVRQATPLLQDHMEILVRLASRPKVDARARANRAARDRALLLLGFCGAFRRSELASLQLEHLSFDHKGLLIKLPRSKTDQEGKGAYLARLPSGP